MWVPDDLPLTTDRYYVALSIFDGAESYDQVGFADNNGSWEIFYADATACGTRPDVHWDALSIDRNSTYTFEISIAGGGVVLFETKATTGAVVWKENVHTGATYLQVESTQQCGTATVPGLTESEEVYAASLGHPPYNFFLTNATEDGAPEKSWVELNGSDNSTLVDRSGSNVTIFNAPFTIGFAGASDQTTIETAASSQHLRTTVSVVMETSGAAVGLSAYTAAAGWLFSETPSSSNTSFVAVLNITVPASTVAGVFVVEIEASNSAGFANRVALVVTALSGLSLTLTTHPTTGEVDANESATILANATGGRPSYSYSWPMSPGGCAVVSVGTFSCHLPVPGNFMVVAGVSDTLGYALFQDTQLVAVPDPVLSGLPTNVGVVGSSLTIAVALEGGLAPFTFTWQSLPSGCGSVNATWLNCTPTSPGHYSVTVTSVDRTGFRSSVTVPVTVGSEPGAGPFDLGALGLDLVGAGLVVLIATCVVVLIRRSRFP
jgi:hypothetical protein